MKVMVLLLLFTILFSPFLADGQHNVGIGTNTPEYPLDVNGRIRLRYNPGGLSSGIWYNRADNALASFVGQFDDTLWGIYNASPAQWRVLFDHKNTRIGIGALPGYPLTFTSNIGDKISLWGGGNGNSSANHYGFGIQANLLQIFSPSEIDNIAFGTGRSAEFNEKVRITGTGRLGIGTPSPTHNLDVNGSLRIRGNGAAAGKVLTSIDANGVATWDVAKSVKAYRGNRNTNSTVNSGFPLNFSFSHQFNDAGLTFSGNSFVIPDGGGVFQITMQVTISLSSSFSGAGMLQLDLQKITLENDSYLSRSYLPLVYTNANLKSTIVVSTIAQFEGGNQILFTLNQNTGVNQTVSGAPGETFITITKLY